MKIVIFAQEEPAFMGPMIIKVLEKRHKDVQFVALFGLREGARKPRGIVNKIKRIVTYEVIFGFFGFIKVLRRKMIYYFMKNSGRQNDFFSIRRACNRLRIPLYDFSSSKDSRLIDLLKNKKADIILNQSDFIIQNEIIHMPKLGIINRHGSILPNHKGRMASYWSHVEGREYGITIHFITDKIDTGDIILKRILNLSPKDFYYNIITDIFKESSNCILDAFSLLEDPSFKPRHMKETKNQKNEFPTLRQALINKEILRKRYNE